MTTPDQPAPRHPPGEDDLRERRVLRELLSTVHRTGDTLRWDLADPYLRRHVVEHAARAGHRQLVRLLDDGEFLVNADPTAVAAVLPPFRDAYPPPVRRTLDVYCASIGWHQHVEARARRQILALDALRLGHHELAERMRRAPGGHVLPWRCLWSTATNISASSGATMTGHAGRINALVTTHGSNGTLAVTGSEDRTARVWDLGTGTTRHVLLHAQAVKDVAVATLDDRTVLLTAAERLTLWDPGTGRALRSVPVPSGIRAVAVSDGTGCAVVTTDGPTYVADLGAGTAGRPWPVPVAGGRAKHVAVGREGGEHFALTVTAQHGVTAFSLPGRRLLHRGNPLPGDPVTAFTVADVGGQTLAVTGHRSGAIAVAHAHTGAVLHTLRLTGLAEHWLVRAEVRALAVCPGESSWLAFSGHKDGILRAWDLAAGRLLWAARQHAGPVNALVPGEVLDTPVLVSASDDDTVRCWDTRTGSLRDVLAGHTSGVTGAALTRVGARPVAVTVSKDRTVRTWDTTREEPPRVPDGHPRWVRSLALHRVAGRLCAVTTCRDDQVRVIDAGDGQLVTRLETTRNLPLNTAVPIRAGDTTLIAAGGIQGHLVLWDVRPPAGTPVDTTNLGTADVVALGVLPHDRGGVQVIAGGSDGSVTIWYPGGRAPLRDFVSRRRRTGDIACLDVADTGGEPLVVTGDFDGYVRVRSLRTADLVHTRLYGAPVRALATGTLGTDPCLAVGTADGEIRVLRLGDAAVLAELRGHTGAVRSLTFARLGGEDVLFSGSADGTVRGWDLRDGEQAHRIDLPDIVQTVAHRETSLAIGYGREVSVFTPVTAPPRESRSQ
ncbi:NB-ARC domain-containing protein [Streptomyces viridochromogenes DSM 40736]|uniref:NB-ARC domain-containing protein n=1 Tax=Streptomyces viridochromogenes (strain DSM 40736 / JCM 4977 / BCRC 1201 / Tue 494) TaxID=591159 RepID=D9XA50_STRVT|nr:NB-ARC domain-containing protein [Streptomyces viridochromogenes]EFL36440.1 NB-ARC domain-containing protein [Streptomyces viridochromogenes DSM 40736]